MVAYLKIKIILFLFDQTSKNKCFCRVFSHLEGQFLTGRKFFDK
jgi:hypothetical protein